MDRDAKRNGNRRCNFRTLVHFYLFKTSNILRFEAVLLKIDEELKPGLQRNKEKDPI